MVVSGLAIGGSDRTYEDHRPKGTIDQIPSTAEICLNPKTRNMCPPEIDPTHQYDSPRDWLSTAIAKCSAVFHLVTQIQVKRSPLNMSVRLNLPSLTASKESHNVYMV